MDRVFDIIRLIAIFFAITIVSAGLLSMVATCFIPLAPIFGGVCTEAYRKIIWSGTR